MSDLFQMMFQGAAGAGGAGLAVEEVFSQVSYIGNGSSMQITNNLDMSGEGGLIWEKNRDGSAYWHHFRDSETGADKMQELPNSSNLQNVGAGSFNSIGYTATNTYGATINGRKYISWGFRKAERFFDIQTWSGNGVNGRQISHNLGQSPGMIIVHRTSGGSEDWAVLHRSQSPSNGILYLNQNFGNQNTPIFNGQHATSSVFYVSNHPASNETGSTYVAYIFGHNDSSSGNTTKHGIFGQSGAEEIIKCGNYYVSTATSGTNTYKVDLGWEPQWVMIKRTGGNGDWYIADSVRGTRLPNITNSTIKLSANTQETDQEAPVVSFDARGFHVWDTNSAQQYNNYIYMAIRRGFIDPVKDVTNTDAFATDTWGGGNGSTTPAYYSGWPVDFAIDKSTSSSFGLSSWNAVSRNTQKKKLNLNQTQSLGNLSSGDLDWGNGWYSSTANPGPNAYRSWMWRRYPKIMDVNMWIGTGSGGHKVYHNLQTTPEAGLFMNVDGGHKFYYFDSATFREGTTTNNGTMSSYSYASGNRIQAIDDESITFGNGQSPNGSGDNYYGVFWATYPGISKIGTFTYSYPSSPQVVDCGFTNGARFVLIKRVSGGSNFDSWFVWDSARGITTSADPFLRMDTTAVNAYDGDNIRPDSSGFAIQNSGLNLAAGTECFFMAFA